MGASWTARRERIQSEFTPLPHVSGRVRQTARLTTIDTGGMPWSWRIGTFAGIDVYIHATFFILIAWLLLLYFTTPGSTPLEALTRIGFVLTLFLCVVLHEYGHALMARHYGIKTRDITLLPIGGVARLERIPREPSRELAVALAGPAVNMVIAAVLYVILFAASWPLGSLEGALGQPGGHFLASLAYLNVVLAVFNLLPAFPMDGGRVLRALLAMHIPRVQATRIASFMGQGMAVLFGLAGLMGNPFLVLIAVFVYLGAAQEYHTIRWEAAVEGLSAQSAMVTRYRTLQTNDPLLQVVEILLQGAQHDFPVLDEKARVVGMLLRQDLIAALSGAGGSGLSVRQAMRKLTASARPDEPLETVFERMQRAQLPVMPVFDANGTLVGLLTMENVAEVVLVQNALAKARSAHARHAA